MCIAERSVTWDGHSRVVSAVHTYWLIKVSIGKLIDTVFHESFKHAGETVECLQHIQDLKAIRNS